MIAALIQVYRDDEPTDRYVGHKFSTLTKERSANPAHKIEPVLNERMGDLLLHRGQFVPSSANTEDRTVEVTWTTGAPVLRRGASGSYYEELALGEAVNMERLNSGAPPAQLAPSEFTLRRCRGCRASMVRERGGSCPCSFQ